MNNKALLQTYGESHKPQVIFIVATTVTLSFFPVKASHADMCTGDVQLKHELTMDQEGPTYDVFARVLRGLSNGKLAKPGKFRTSDGLGYALRCSYKVCLPYA